MRDDRLFVRCWVYNFGGDVRLGDSRYLPLFPFGVVGTGRNEVRFWVDDKRMSRLYSGFSREFARLFAFKMGDTFLVEGGE